MSGKSSRTKGPIVRQRRYSDSGHMSMSYHSPRHPEADGLMEPLERPRNGTCLEMTLCRDGTPSARMHKVCSAGSPLGGEHVWNPRVMGKRVPASVAPKAHLGNSPCSGFLLPVPLECVALEIFFPGGMHPPGVTASRQGHCQKELSAAHSGGTMCVPRGSPWAPRGAPLPHSDGK